MNPHPLSQPEAPGSVQTRRRDAGFTMVEIAICIAVVAFALVAIIGVMPTGLQVQRQNREDTIIAQEGKLWLEAIRSGALGLNDLTNYVDEISVNTRTNRVRDSGVWRASTYRLYDGSSGLVGFRNGRDIIGLLTLPQYYQWGATNARMEFESLPSAAYVRAMTGSAAEKTIANEFALMYRLRTELVPFSAITGMNTNLNESGLSDADKRVRLNTLLRASALMANLYELRLTVDWPVYRRQNRFEVGGNRKVFRTLVGGSLAVTNVDYLDQRHLFFLQPSQFVLP